VDVRPVDPRDTTWEVDEPAYRVYFWRPVPQPIGVPRGLASEEFEVTGADVQEVIAWAEATAGSDRAYTLYALVRCPKESSALFDWQAPIHFEGVAPAGDIPARWPSRPCSTSDLDRQYGASDTSFLR